MAGHSHAANIKYRKAAVDAKRSKIFSKCAKLIIVAARTGGGDPDANLSLRYAIDKAKAANMTNDSIARAVKKGTGELEAESYEEVAYEGYGPGGVAFMATGLTDNRARTGPEMKKIFERRGGSLGTPGSVAWQFEKKASVRCKHGGKDEDELLLELMEAGAEDLRYDEEDLQVVGPPDMLTTIRDALEAMGLTIGESEVVFEPTTLVPVADVESAKTVLGLVEDLEDHDDIQNVSANYDIPDDVVRIVLEG